MAELTQEMIQKLREAAENIGTGKKAADLPDIGSQHDKIFVPVNDGKGVTRKMTLRDIRDEAADPVAGRWWDERNSSPTATGYYGSAAALRDLPRKLGLGRYLVTDDRVRRKLDPSDSTKFADGSPAALDGSIGQCMWCWNAHYYTTWEEDNKTVEVITFAPVRGRDSVYVPAGGKSWFDAGVLDNETGTLCSIVSDEPRYRGGNGMEVSVTSYPYVPPGSPQQTMLGMPRTFYNSIQFGQAARRRGEGWEANWYIAQAVTEYLPRIILGTRNIQSEFNPEPDANGLMQGGMGAGVTDWADGDNQTTGKIGWYKYNGNVPLIPTSFGLEVGDGTTVLPYTLSKADGTEMHTFEVPVFFGYVNPNYGNLYNHVRGLLIDHAEEAPSRAYIAPSMFAEYNGNAITDDMLLVGDLPRLGGYIKRVSMRYLASLPVEVGASSETYFADHYYSSVELIQSYGLRIRLSSGRPSHGAYAGAVTCYTHTSPPHSSSMTSSPLCYFEEDPSPFPVTTN